MSLKQLKLWTLIGAAVLLAACTRSGPPVAPSLPATAAPTQPAAVPTTAPTLAPTPTDAPLAATVNGLQITLAAYQAELGRYQSALGKDLTDADRKIVLDALLDQALLAQAAAGAGYTGSDVQARLDAMAQELGGQIALEDWMAANGYTAESLRQDLSLSLAAAWMRDQVTAAVPESAEQVHARQIIATSAEAANEAYTQLQAGTDFATLAKQYDLLRGGDLGWFPRGYLTDPKLDEAIFALETGQYTPVVQTPAGFHIVQVIERQAQRPLEPGARQALQAQALNQWLDEQRQQARIEILAP